jgi:alkanesulfonate monooxygenase
LQRVIDTARWSERWGCKGMLVYSDNRQLDPWLIAHLVMLHTLPRSRIYTAVAST